MQPHILSQTFKTSSLIMNFYISLFLFLKGKVLVWCMFLLNHLLIVYCGTHSLPLLVYIKYKSGICAPHQDLINLSDKNCTWLTDSLVFEPPVLSEAVHWSIHWSVHWSVHLATRLTSFFQYWLITFFRFFAWIQCLTSNQIDRAHFSRESFIVPKMR